MAEIYIRKELEEKGLEVYRCNGCNRLFPDIANQPKVMCPACFKIQDAEII